MFAFTSSPVQVPREVTELFRDTFEHLAAPGTWWSGADRISIASLARDHRAGTAATAPSSLPEAVRKAVELIAARPALTTERWVREVCSAIGEPAYVELVGIVSCVVCIDTVTRLLGSTAEPLPDPEPGEPTRDQPSGSARRQRTWVAIDGLAIPPNVLSLVPGERNAARRLTYTLYMTGRQMGEPDIALGDLHRTQMELVAATVSHANECFY